MFIDSHAHIDGAEYDADRADVLSRARAAGVRAILTVGTGDPHGDNFARAQAVAGEHEDVYFSVGVHPHDARLYDDRAAAKIRAMLKDNSKALAVGEIGLDYHYDHSPRDVQRDVFIGQLELARELALPVIIHSRDADDDTLEILLSKWNGGSVASPLRSGLMHCYGGSAAMAYALLARDFYISFAGNVTFAKAEALRRAAEIVPLDRLLIETDCPYLSPVPLRGRRNEPSHIVHTARFLADLKGVSLEELARATTNNFARLFRLDLQT